MLFDANTRTASGQLRKHSFGAPTRSRGTDVGGDPRRRARIFSALSGSATKARIDRLIETSAWTDATLTLAELELPQWKLRRLIL